MDVTYNPQHPSETSSEQTSSPHRLMSTETRNFREVSPDTVITVVPSIASIPRQLWQNRKQKSRPRNVYAHLIADMKNRYKINIRQWQPQMSGVAYELKYNDGRIKRLITAPKPRSPISAAIFLHEVGHHAVGFHRYTPRCLEEYYAWQWALREMDHRQIPITEKVLKHYRRSMMYYVQEAQDQGVTQFPDVLQAFVNPHHPSLASVNHHHHHHSHK